MLPRHKSAANFQLQRTSTRSLVSLASRFRRRVEAAELEAVSCLMPDDFDELFAKIRVRHASFRNSCDREQLGAHVRSLAGEDRAGQTDVPAPPFPQEVDVTFATCACGAREFIVEGSTQECQHCGALMFRHESRKYSLSDSTGS